MNLLLKQLCKSTVGQTFSKIMSSAIVFAKRVCTICSPHPVVHTAIFGLSFVALSAHTPAP